MRDARNNLRYALSNLRHVIGDRAQPGDREASPPFLLVSRQTIQFNEASDARTDTIAFDRLLKAPKPTVRELEEAVDLYRGEFLEGFFVADSVPFEEWVLLKREQFRRQVLAALHRLATTHEGRGEYGRALPYAYRQIELEPWREQTHRQLMRLLALNDQRGAALAQYETCRQALAEELGVEPAQETTRLYEQIRDGALVPGQGEELGTGEAGVPLPHQAEEATPSATAPARRRSADRRMFGRRLAIAGAGLLLLAIAVMQAITLFGAKGDPAGAASPSPLVPPDGKILHLCVGMTPPQICMYETQTDQITQVTHALDFETIGRLSWSPDGEQIVFGAGSVSATAPQGDHQLYVIDADGSALRPLTSDGTSDAEPAWSPDGQWIAFNRSGELWIVRPDGSEAQRLFDKPEKPCVGDLSWSPNSQQIAFVGRGCTPVPTPEEIWVINRDGTAPQMVYSFEWQPGHAEVLWSDNGQAILCAHRHEGEEARLLLISASGVGEPSAMDRFPYWWHPTFWPQWGGGE